MDKEKTPVVLTDRTIEELKEFVLEMEGVPPYPKPEIAVELKDGVLYEVGGNWRTRRKMMQDPKYKPPSAPKDSGLPWMGWMAQMLHPDADDT